HGSNEPWSIGHAVSSGCIRLTNDEVVDLYKRVKVGTRVVVLSGDESAERLAALAKPVARKAPVAVAKVSGDRVKDDSVPFTGSIPASASVIPESGAKDDAVTAPAAASEVADAEEPLPRRVGH